MLSAGKVSCFLILVTIKVSGLNCSDLHPPTRGHVTARSLQPVGDVPSEALPARHRPRALLQEGLGAEQGLRAWCWLPVGAGRELEARHGGLWSWERDAEPCPARFVGARGMKPASPLLRELLGGTAGWHTGGTAEAERAGDTSRATRCPSDTGQGDGAKGLGVV